MAAMSFLAWLGNDPAEADQKPSPELSANVYVTQKELMDALKHLQSQVEDRLRAERNKRARRFEKLNDDVAKRFAEVEGNLLYEIHQQGKAGNGVHMPRDTERLGQTFAPPEPRPDALARMPSGSSLAVSAFGDDKSVVSEASEAGRKVILVEQLKSKVERLETGLRSLVNVAKASTIRRPDGMLTDGATIPQTSAVGSMDSLSTMSGLSAPAALADKVESWTTKLVGLESDMQMFSRRVTDVEVKMKAFEQQLDGRVQALIKRDIASLGLDRGR